MAQSADGTLTILVAQPPEALPPVRPRDLEAAWDDARAAARNQQFGPARLFRFLRGEEAATDLALTDRDARCWAGAVDARWGMDTIAGLTLCLRLLALVDVLARAPWGPDLVRIEAGEAELDPALLQAAATVALNREARFDEETLHHTLAHGSTHVSTLPDASPHRGARPSRRTPKHRMSSPTGVFP